MGFLPSPTRRGHRQLEVGEPMSVNINVVVQSGIVKWPALRYDGNGRPKFRFTLYRETANADGQVFPLSIPCCSPGGTGERQDALPPSGTRQGAAARLRGGLHDWLGRQRLAMREGTRLESIDPLVARNGRFTR
jgi:hypothetical protein